MSMDVKNSAFPDARLLAVGQKPSAPAGSAEAKKMAEEFSSLLLLEMLKSMRATLSEEGLDGEKSSARENYSSLADVEVTRSLAKHDGVGLTAFLERSLGRIAASDKAKKV